MLLLAKLYPDVQRKLDRLEGANGRFIFKTGIPADGPNWEGVNTRDSTLTKEGGVLSTTINIDKIEKAGPDVRTVADVFVHALDHIIKALDRVEQGKSVQAWDRNTEEKQAYHQQILYRDVMELGVGKKFLDAVVSGNDLPETYRSAKAFYGTPLGAKLGADHKQTPSDAALRIRKELDR